MAQTEVHRARAERAGPPGRARPAPAPPDSAGGGRAARDLRTVKVLWHRETIRFSRNKLRIAMGMVTPLMFLLVLGTGLNSAMSEDSLRDFRAFLFPGVVLMSVQAPAIAVGASIVWDRRSGFLRQMLVAPVRRSAILVGTCLGGATSGAAYGVLVLLLGPVADVPYHPQLLLVLLQVVLVSFAFTALGVAAAVCIRRPETFQVAVSLCMLPLFFLSGAMFPVDGLPGWLGTVVRLNPLTYAVDALRRTMPGDGATAMGGGSVSPEWWGWTPPVLAETGLIAAFALLSLTIATRRFSRVE
ncbi:ABC transporter permease [Streptomyces calvus]|uniref:ABC transporter permease n=1 Tax=Streptomyces calvus TaxID=67282 RepID=UPI00371011D8